MDACPNSGHHKTIHIEYENQSADVDEKIAPLILLMWKNGIETAFSCQDFGESNGCDCHKEVYTIQFRGDENLNKFLDLVQVPLDDIFRKQMSVIHPFPTHFWTFETYPVWITKTMMMHSILLHSKYEEYLTIRLNRCLGNPNSEMKVTHEEVAAILRAVDYPGVFPPVP